MAAGLSSQAAARRAERSAILEELLEYAGDPYGFVLDWFPWGQPGTDLEHETGPDEWQTDLLIRLRDKLITAETAIRFATASGHGVGKSALVAWLILWAFSTREHTRGVVTANTDTQLRTKTWAELAKWFNLFRARSLFRLTATGLFSADAKTTKTWRIDQVPWSLGNMDAFSGLHNKGKRILVIFDEASTIADGIWERTDGALTDKDTEIIWAVFGNPSLNTGRFRECFGKYRHRWECTQVDGRKAKSTNKALIAEYLADHDEDSDFIRVRVRGVFPRASSMQFISGELVENAAKREAISYIHDAMVLGVDVARFGDDASVIKPRKGRDARTWKAIKLRNVDTMQLAARVQQVANELGADAVFVDEGGIGAGVVDRLRQLKVRNVIGVQFGAKPDRAVVATGAGEATKYKDKRAEMWGMMRDWLPGGAIEGDAELHTDLTGVEFGYNENDAIVLEKKEHMKKRGLASPDNGDALALTFAYPVEASATAGGPHAARRGPVVAAGTNDYDPYD